MTSNRLRRFASDLKARAATCATRFAKDSRGNATMLVAFAMPMIIGGGGMAIDFGQYYLWKRELQYANDQAAIAAAWEMVEHPSSGKMSERALYAFRTNEQVTDSFNTEPTVHLANYLGGVGNSVIVESSATKRMPFSGFFTGRATTVKVSSQAMFAEGATYSSCLVATEEEDGGTIIIGGNAVFTAQCGIMAVSNSSKTCTEYDTAGVCTSWTGEDAIDDNGNSYEIKAGTMVTAGTVSDTLQEKAEANGDTVIEGQDGLSDPYADAEIPDDSNAPQGIYYCKATGKLKDSYNALNDGKEPTDADYVQLGTAYPGIYEGGITIGCDTTFKSGVYFLEGGSLIINGNNAVTSEGGVMFVLKDGATFSINGGADINLSGMSEEELKAIGYTSDEASVLSRMMIFEDPDGPETGGNKLNGNDNTFLNGAIYTPNSTLSLQGTADVANACLLMVADKVVLTGTLNMTSWCDDDEAKVTTVIYGTVRLVS